MAEQLSDDQKRCLYRDGYVVLKGAVSPELIDAARARIKRATRDDNLWGEKEMTDLLNASSLTPILHEAVGRFDPPSGAHIGIVPKRERGKSFNPLGYRDRDMPYYGTSLHAEGMLTNAAPQEVELGTPDEIYRRYIASGPKGDLGRSADVIGHNLVPLFQDPELSLSLGSFNVFAFVSLNDQTREGCGQTMVVPGSHHALERFYRWQFEQTGCIGPEGPGWPRMDHETPNRCGLVYLPDAVRDEFTDETSERTPDGRRWPRPVQVLLEPGDAILIHYQLVHSGSFNENGSESRKNIIFRIRNKRRQPGIVVPGTHDHPDRGPRGEWLEFEDGNDPWARSKVALCNIWDEWEGMQSIVHLEKESTQ
jgi:hypothetical protein